MKVAGILVLAVILLSIPFVYAGTADIWAQCTDANPNQWEDKTKEGYFCCALNNVFSWETTKDNCFPQLSSPSATYNQLTGSITFSVTSVEEETPPLRITIDIDEDGDNIFEVTGATCPSSTSCDYVWSCTHPNTGKYEIKAVDNSAADGACGPSGCATSTGKLSFVCPGEGPTCNIIGVTPVPPNGWMKEGTYQFNVDDEPNPPANSVPECEWDYKNNGVQFPRATRVCNSPTSFLLPVGLTGKCSVNGVNTCEVSVYCRDNRYPVSDENLDIETYSVDLDKPVVSAISSSIDPPCVNHGTFIQSSASDTTPGSGITGCTMYDNNADQGSVLSACTAGTSCTINKNYAFTTTGPHTLRIDCSDLAGNIGSQTSKSFDVLPTSDPRCTAPPTPSITLVINPPTIAADGVETSTITAVTSNSGVGIAISFSTTLGTLSSPTCTTGSTGSCSVAISSSTTGIATVTASSTGYTSGTGQVTFSSAPCIYRVSITTDNFDSATKHGTFLNEKSWLLTLIDSSSSGCESTITYDIPSVSTTPVTCHSASGLHAPLDDPKPGNVLSSHTFSVQRGGTLNPFIQVYARALSDVCTVSFDIMKGSEKIDPTFTVSPNLDPPFVSIFDYSGDLTRFDVNWGAYYTIIPDRPMDVYCGLNCNPLTENCNLNPGEACQPYPVNHGSGSTVKTGACTVPNPAYDFATPLNQVNCLFYDPNVFNSNDPSTYTIHNENVLVIDFEIAGSSIISASPGDLVEGRIDLINRGLIPDSYTVTVTGDATAVDITTPTQSIESIFPGQALPVFFDIRPLSSETSIITVTVTSNIAPSVTKIFDIEIRGGFFALPEFGLLGLIQIIAIAAVAYFMIMKRAVNTSKIRVKRKKRKN